MLESVSRVITNVFKRKLADHKVPLRVLKDIKNAVNATGCDWWRL
jgi:hypothetical protein